MNIRRLIPLAALAVVAWMPADANAQTATRQVDDAVRAAEGRGRTAVDGVTRRGDDAVEQATRRGGDEVERRGGTMTEREIMTKMANAEKKHVERMAKLDRLRTLFSNNGDSARVREIDTLRSQEQSRRQRQIRNGRDIIGSAEYDRYSARLRDAKQQRKGRADRKVNDDDASAARRAQRQRNGNETDPTRGEPVQRGRIERDDAGAQRANPGATRRGTTPAPARTGGTSSRDDSDTNRGRGR